MEASVESEMKWISQFFENKETHQKRATFDKNHSVW